MDYRLPGFSIHRILQARVLEWVAISFSSTKFGPANKPGSTAFKDLAISTWKFCFQEKHCLLQKRPEMEESPKRRDVGLKGEVTNKTMYVGREIKFLTRSQGPRWGFTSCRGSCIDDGYLFPFLPWRLSWETGLEGTLGIPGKPWI